MNRRETRVFSTGLELVGHEQTVPVLGDSACRQVNLDSAASTPALAEVLATVNRFMNWTSRRSTSSPSPGLTAADVVLVSQMEHHGNNVPWRARAQVVHVGVNTEGRLDETHLEHLLAQHAGRVRLPAVTVAPTSPAQCRTCIAWPNACTRSGHRYSSTAHSSRRTVPSPSGAWRGLG